MRTELNGAVGNDPGFGHLADVLDRRLKTPADGGVERGLRALDALLERLDGN